MKHHFSQLFFDGILLFPSSRCAAREHQTGFVKPEVRLSSAWTVPPKSFNGYVPSI